MKRLLYGALLCFAFFLSGCAENPSEPTKWEQVKEEGKLVVGTSGTLVGVSYTPEDSDELTGYDVEVMEALGEQLGIEIVFKEMGVDDMFAAIKSGKVDAAINDFQINEDRKENYLFTNPYKYSYTTMIVREENLSGIETVEDLDEKKAGGEATTTFSEIARYYGARVVTYDNVSNEIYLKDVHRGILDVIINDYYLSKLGLQAYPQYDLVLHPDIKLNPTEHGILLKKEDYSLQENLNEALIELRRKGTLTRLSEKFFGEDASVKPTEPIQPSPVAWQ
ncbi:MULTISPECIES: transporter substrate-binding domain-containing protein [Pontibacillus]|uniref:Transporter substrate-binding domain-containing protein n=1 Tax=Pontibacillus chungwhensis TaxID=265426 RepID=A0ABY8UZB1_9BACI|nr:MULTISPECIES: transporter substrate-binding domain-containing protein [Pontibacillus]MCD5325475.1 transporter substrate-binding domain-containing protein [Pontibacillus sp. HN14]WIF98588.1 transporter substrate-binding domain-containing protein [Pontibacillus chungwhensis]